MKLPISAVVPKNVNPHDLQLCASLVNGQQKCQPLTQNAANIDLSNASSGAATTTPQAYQESSSRDNILNVLSTSIIQYADAQLISVNNTTLNIPITVIVPKVSWICLKCLNMDDVTHKHNNCEEAYIFQLAPITIYKRN
jgi:hypothetical protein